MLKRFFPAILLSVALIGKIHAQEVIVAREKKSELSTQTPQRSEQFASESSPAAPRKSKSREKKSMPARLTLEEMRAAGARAAEGSNDRVSNQRRCASRMARALRCPTPLLLKRTSP